MRSRSDIAADSAQEASWRPKPGEPWTPELWCAYTERQRLWWEAAGIDPLNPEPPKPPPIWSRYATAKSDFDDAAENLSFARDVLGCDHSQELAEFKRCDAECVAAHDELKAIAERRNTTRQFAEPIDFGYVELLAEHMEREQANRVRFVRHYARRKRRIRRD